MNRRKLKDQDAIDMRELYASGDFTVRALAEMYGCAPVTAWHIINGYSYQSVTGGEPVELPKTGHTFTKNAAKGSDHPCHKLEDEDVIAIRKKVAKKGVYGQRMKLYRALARQYNVSQVTIASIATSGSWKHLPSVEDLRRKK